MDVGFAARGTAMQLETLADYANYVGHKLAPSPWVKVDQKMIDDFGEVTGDRNWYHVDVERAAREIPGGRTIAHGLLTLSLVPHLASQIVSVRRRGRAFNYGFDRVRFPAPVPAGSRIRLHMQIISVERKKDGMFIRNGYTMELEGASKPALSAEMMVLAYD
jgi:acyl dehydratase